MKTESTDYELAELLGIVDAAIAAVLEDREHAAAEARDPASIWDLFSSCPHALAVAERRLEYALSQRGIR